MPTASWREKLAEPLTSGANVSHPKRILSGALGGYFVQTAYSVGAPDLVIAGLTVVDPLVAVIIGITVFGEASEVPLWVILTWLVVGTVAVIGVFQLARHHPQTHR